MDKRSYLIHMKASCVVFVEDAKNEDQAFDFAQELAHAGDFEIWESEAELLPDDEEKIESARRNADLVSEAS